MQMDLYYWKICDCGGCGGHAYHENYGRICTVGGHVLRVCAEAATIKAALSSVCW